MSFNIDTLNTNSFKSFEEYCMEITGRGPNANEGFVGQKWLDNVHGNEYYKLNEGWAKLVDELPGDGSWPLIIFNNEVLIYEYGIWHKIGIQIFTTLPDASQYPGQVAMSPRWPLVGSLPGTVVDGQRLRIAEVGQTYGREYLGRSVVELNSTDDFILYPIPTSIDNGWAFEKTFRDLNSLESATILYCVYDGDLSPSNRAIQITYIDSEINAYFRDTDNIVSITNAVSIVPNEFNTVRLEIINDYLVLTVGKNSASVSINLSKKKSFTNSGCFFPASEDTPLQVCCVKQYMNGQLIDWFKCDESTGTTLANTVSPFRPATLSDSSAYSLAWVPQPSVTMGVWQSDGSEWWPLSPIPILDLLPADDSTFGTVVIVGNDVYIYVNGSWLNKKYYEGDMPTILDRLLNVVVFGDSTADSSSYAKTDTLPQLVPFPSSGQTIVSVHQQSFSFAKFVPSLLVANCGVPGQKTTQMISRSGLSYTDSRKAIEDGIACNPDLFLFHLGVNDVVTWVTESSDHSVIDGIISRIIKLVECVQDSGIYSICTGIIGYNGDGNVEANKLAARRAAIVEINNTLQSYFTGSSKVRFVNTNGVLNNNGSLIDGISDDGTHMNAYGGYILGSLEAAVAKTLFIPKYSASSVVYDGMKDFVDRSIFSPNNWYLSLTGATANSKKTDIDGIVIDATISSTTNEISLYMGDIDSAVCPAMSNMTKDDSLVANVIIDVRDSQGNAPFYNYLVECNFVDSTLAKVVKLNTDIGGMKGRLELAYQFSPPESYANLGLGSYITYGINGLPVGTYTVTIKPFMVYKLP